MELGPLTQGRFVRRLNRFAALVEVGGRRVLAHVANSGRLREVFVTGSTVYLRPVPRGGRRCPYDLALVRAGGTLVSADARLPNALVGEALRAGRIVSRRRDSRLRAEVRHGDSRLDFGLEGGGWRCLVETKSVTLEERGVALFPDAPTARGRRHLEVMARACRRGTEAAVVFVVQRGDAERFRPHWEADPKFARALVRAAAAGVRVLAYRCRVSREAIALEGAIPVRLERVRGGDEPRRARRRGRKTGLRRGRMPRR